MEKKGYFILRKATIHNEDIKIISIDAFDYTEAILMSQKKWERKEEINRCARTGETGADSRTVHPFSPGQTETTNSTDNSCAPC